MPLPQFITPIVPSLMQLLGYCRLHFSKRAFVFVNIYFTKEYSPETSPSNLHSSSYSLKTACIHICQFHKTRYKSVFMFHKNIVTREWEQLAKQYPEHLQNTIFHFPTVYTTYSFSTYAVDILKKPLHHF